ncbi:MAG: ribonuclease H-like domain-containing protein [Gammaproteobacteria bacterium]
MDTETAGLVPGDAVYVVALHDPRCQASCAVYDAQKHKDRHILYAVDAMSKWKGQICSFNGTKFDFQMLAAATADTATKQRCARLALSHVDIMLQFAADKGYYASLESFAVPTVGRGKIGSGASVVDDWAAGKYDEIRAYCADDAKLTSDLYAYGANFGRLKRTTKAGKTSTWTLPENGWLAAHKALDTTGVADVSWMQNPPDVAAAADWAVALLAS